MCIHAYIHLGGRMKVISFVADSQMENNTYHFSMAAWLPGCLAGWLDGSGGEAGGRCDLR